MQLLLKVDNNNNVEKFPVSYEEFVQLHSNVSFEYPLKREVIKSLGYDIIFEVPQPEYDKYTQNIVTTGPVFNQEEDRWETGFEVVEMTSDEKITIRVNAEASVRTQREYLLMKSDWSQLPDVIENMSEEKIQEWKQYRQALRDVTLQDGFPFDVIYPTQPE